ncbi:MAG: site-specific integrase [Ignavibacteriales bacterium]|nr:site-specific integrase [Ignavibacteriales bacterium]
MSTRKIRNAWWVDFRVEGIRYRKKSPENSQVGARAFELTLRQRLSRGESIMVTKKEQHLPTFKEFSEQWYTTYVQTNNKASEQKSKRVMLNAHLIPFFGREKIDEITTLQVERYKAEKLKTGLSPKTINNHLIVLRTSLRCAEDWIGIQHRPNIKPLTVPPQKFDFFSLGESEMFLNRIKDPFWHTMVLVALRTGLRLGELVGLQWGDINFEQRLLTVRRAAFRKIVSSPKNNRVRHIPLTPSVCQSLFALGPSEGYVFRRRTAGPMDHKTPQYAIHNWCRRAGMRKIGWHTLRHTFASHLAMKGVSMRAIQELLGHSDIHTTMRYAHLTPSTLRDAVAVLEPITKSSEKLFGHSVGNTQKVDNKKELCVALFDGSGGGTRTAR